MHLPSLTALLTLLLTTTTTTTLAAPADLLPRQGTTTPARFRLRVRWSNAPDLSGPIHANGGSFWLKKPTRSYCPGQAVIKAPCPRGAETSFTGGGGGDGRLALNVAVPGGQQVFIGPRGLLRYTQAHSAQMPRGAVTSGLVVQEGTRFLNPFYQLWACNTDGDAGVWQIWVEQRDVEGNQRNWGKTERNACTRVNLEAVEAADEVAAWQYD